MFNVPDPAPIYRCGMSDMTMNESVSQSVLRLVYMGNDYERIPGFVDGF